MQFDASYEPIVAGQTLFIGSPNDGSIAAYDTETGDRKWRFYTDGPIRFAPVVWEGKLYAASDDGRVYCLAADTGRVKWTFRAAPGERPDLRHLGNNRLISSWPVRGGPLLVDGTLYFGSGLWATMGTFVYALDAETGKVVWHNDRLNYMANIRVDHNRVADSVLAPQGYLLHAGGKLFVPNGRSMPVGLDPKTGRLLHYVQGYRNGECRVTAQGKYLFVGRRGVLDVNTGREIGERWHEGDPETPKSWSIRYDLFETPFHPYKFIPACDAWSVQASGAAYGGRHGAFYAYDITKATKSTYKRKHGGHELRPGKWEAPLLWKLPTEYSKDKPPSSTIVQAGRRLYGHAGQVLVALDLPAAGQRPKIAWQRKLDGTPSSMAAGDGKLFVATEEGRIYCFGARQGEPKVHALPNAPLPATDDTWTRRAAEILETTPDAEGYCLVLGLSSGRLVEELLQQSRLRVIAIDPDKAKVDALRDKLAAARLYGDRAWVLVGDPFRFCFPPYIASLAVSEAYGAGEIADKMRAEDLVKVLRPYGGTACLAVPGERWPAVETWAATGQVENAKLSRAGAFALLRRVGALPGSAHWTHEPACAARTYFSKDKRVKAPLGVLWYGDGPDYGFKKHKDYHVGVKPQVVNGRLFAFNERTRVLRSYDVYTGRMLWQRQVEQFTRFASMPDGIYVAGGNACVVHDPATGAVRQRFEYRVDGDRKLFVADVRVDGSVIVVAVAYEKVRSIPKGLYDSKALIGLDRRTGKQLWTVKASDRFNHHGLAVGGGLVFCVDSPSIETTAAMKRRGADPETLASTVLALYPHTGQVKWREAVANPFLSYDGTSYPTGSVQGLDDALFYSAECDVLIVYKDRRYRALQGQTGRLLWKKARGASQPIMLEGTKYYEQGGAAFDVRTGARVPSNARVRGGNGCNHAVGNEHLIFRRNFTAAYFDIKTGQAHHVRSARSGCTNSLIPADGVLSSPCFSVGCVCNHPLETSFCLVHMPCVEGWDDKEPVREPLPLGERDPAKLTNRVNEE